MTPADRSFQTLRGRNETCQGASVIVISPKYKL